MYAVASLVTVATLLLSSTATSAWSLKDSASGSQQKCNQHRLVPGLETMARGVDITRLSMLPIEEGNRKSSSGERDIGQRRPVMEFTCGQNYKWTNPKSKNAQQFDKPDQVREIVAVDNVMNEDTLTEQMVNQQQSFQVMHHMPTMSDVKQWFAKKAGIASEDKAKVSFGASASFKRTQKWILSENRTLAELSIPVNQMEMNLAKDQIVLSDELKSAIERLQAKSGPFRTDPEEYNQLLARFGTHFWVKARFGGYLQTIALLNKTINLNQKQKEDKILSDLKVVMKQAFGLPTEQHGNEQQQISTDILRTESRYYGGMAQQQGNHLHQQSQSQSNKPAMGTLVSAKQSLKNKNHEDFLRKWMPTLVQKPWLLEGELMPIENLVSIQNHNQTLKQEVEMARRWYQTTAYLDELTNVIQLMSNKKSSSLKPQWVMSEQDKQTLEQIKRRVDGMECERIQEIIADIDRLYNKLEQQQQQQQSEGMRRKLFLF